MPTIYDDVPARRVLARTLRDSDNLPPVPDPVATAEAILLRVPRDIGVGPLEALRRMLDRECAATAARLTPEERARIAAFDATVGLGLKPPVRR